MRPVAGVSTLERTQGQGINSGMIFVKLLK